MVSTAIVFPCYNEAERFDIRAFEVFLAGNKDIDLIFVDDYSTEKPWSGLIF